MSSPKVWALGIAATALSIAACSDEPTATGTAAARAIAIVSGDAQRGVVGQPLSALLAVRVTDAHGRPVSGAGVVFLADDAGVVNPPRGSTNSQGQISVTWQLGPSTSVEHTDRAGGSFAYGAIALGSGFTCGIETAFSRAVVCGRGNDEPTAVVWARRL